jgi:prevent-host-death family protein
MPPKRQGLNTWTLTDAKAQLSALVQRALDGQPQRIVRNGHETVVVVSAATYREAPAPGSIVQLFSALRGVDINFERPKDPPRKVNL